MKKQLYTIITALLIAFCCVPGNLLAQRMDNRAWWNSLPQEWKTLFLSKYTKKSLAATELSDQQLEIIVGANVLDCSGNKEIKDLKPLAQFDRLEVLDVSNTGLKSLDGLQYVPLLKELDCSNSEAIEDLTPLKNMVRLERLNLYNTSVMNLMPLSTLPRLLYLNVGLTFIADNSLYALQKVATLQTLDISENELVRNLVDLSGLQNLTELNCARTSIVTESVKSIATLPNLQVLNISHTRIGSLNAMLVSSTRKVTSLLSIDISNTEIANIDALWANTNLRVINWSNSKVSAESLGCLVFRRPSITTVPDVTPKPCGN